jgi:hypothetical protein
MKYHQRPRAEPTSEEFLALLILLGPLAFVARWIWRCLLREDQEQQTEDSDLPPRILPARSPGANIRKKHSTDLSGTAGGIDPRMIGSVRDSPARSCPTPQKLLICLACDSGIGFAVGFCGMDSSSSSEVTPVPRRRGPGRPSTVAPCAPEVAQWLREDSDLPGAEILRRVRARRLSRWQERALRARQAAEGSARKPG